jgi:hypothetical protein
MLEGGTVAFLYGPFAEKSRSFNNPSLTAG